jgi:hypothetical protein
MKIHTNYLIAFCVAILVAITFFFMTHNNVAEAPTQEGSQMEEVDMIPVPTVLEYGEVELGIGEKAVFEAVQIKPLSVEEDSRCPSDAECIQAGTVRVKIEIVSAMGTSTNTVRLGDFVTTEAEKITFTAASPVPVKGAHIPTSAYTVTFEVTERGEVTLDIEPTPVIPTGACYVGGCSSQLCSNEPGMASTCEYREEYACYQNAVCERQTTGECGWTQTQALNACLAGAAEEL